MIMSNTFNFVGQIDPKDSNLGDVFVNTSTGLICCNNGASIVDLSSPSYVTSCGEYEQPKKHIKPHRCECCGAYLKENSSRCDYCLTEYF